MTEAELLHTLGQVTTASITSLLLKQGLGNPWLRGPRPIRTGQPRAVGRAFTLRFIPGREDLAQPAGLATLRNTRAAIEAMPAGCMVVADAMGTADVGVFGDILCSRMRMLGVSALVTDGSVRDQAGVLASGLSVWSRGIAAPPPMGGLTFINWGEPIGCGGVAIFPGDMIVADDDGAVAIPAALVEFIAEQAPELERLEAWVMTEVEAGVPLPGLYPPNAETQARYAAFLAQQG